MRLVITTRAAVEAEARGLARIKVRREQTTAAVRVERDNIAQLRLSIVDRELRVAHDRSAKRTQLTKLQKTLTHEAKVLDAEAAPASRACPRRRSRSSASRAPSRGHARQITSRSCSQSSPRKAAGRFRPGT